MNPCKKGTTVVNVAAKTINLAKEPIKTRPRCCGRVDPVSAGCPVIPTSPATRIRICTPDQLKSVCPPKPCICPLPPKPLTTGEKVFRAFVLATKWLLLLGFIKWTNDLGVWGNSDSTDRLLDSAQERLAPALKRNNDSECDYGFTYNIATMWNDAVSSLVYAIGVLPAAAAGKMFSVLNNAKFDPPPPPPPPPPPVDKKKK